MTKLSYDFRAAYVVYDCSIEDLSERVEKAMYFGTATAVADYLGVQRVHIPLYTSKEAILKQKRYKSEKHNGKEFAIRIAKNS